MTFYVLEVFDDTTMCLTLKFPVKPTVGHCRSVIAEENGVYGYLVTYSNGRETDRQHLR